MPGNCYTEALPSRLKKYFVILILLLTRGHFITASTLGLDHDITVSVHVVPLAQFRRYADFLPFYQNVLKEGIRYAGRWVIFA